MIFYNASMTKMIDDITGALKARRQAKGLSQRELSARAGVPQGHISKIEAGAVDLRLSSLIDLARALGLEVMLVPRKHVPAVETILRGAAARRPAYTLDERDEEDGDQDA